MRVPALLLRFVCSLVNVVLAVPLVGVVSAPVSAAENAVAPAEVVGEAAASVAAVKSGQPVRVADKTTETEEVVANPDGTFTMNQSLRPVRVRVAGEWTPVDLTLRRRSDGSIGPVAAAVGLRLSGGGTQSPLVVLGDGEHEVGLDWPGTLPTPTLDGPTATYPEVLPGVDLTVTANAVGFTQLLVVKTREAAQNPALRTIGFANYRQNTTVSGGTDGLEVHASDGRMVFSGDASRMWDASGARRAAMGVEVTDTSITITPDQAFLADEATEYPVYVDPSYSTEGAKNHHVVVQSAWPDVHNYDRTDGDLGDLKAGYICAGPCFNSRSYVEMATAGVRGKYIHSATLRTRVLKSFECRNAGPTELWLTGPINADTTWKTQPAWTYALSTNNRTNNPTYCPSDGGADFAATQAVRDSASKGWTSVTLMLRGKDEANSNFWRRFDLNPVLEVVYNSYPNQPDQLATRTGTKTFPCATGAARPYIADREPWLRARLRDPDPAMVNGRFYWGPLGQPATGSAGTAAVPSGSFGEVRVPAGVFVDGGTYAWRVQAGDDQLLSPFSSYCEVTVDTTPPGIPDVSSTDYPEGSETGFAGDPGQFTLSSNGTPDVVRFVYTTDGTDPTPLGSPSVNAAGLGGSATITVTAREARNQVWVRSVDRADNVGPIRKYEFSANGLRPAIANWPFDRQLGDLTYRGTGDPSWSTGYLGDAFRAMPATQDHLTTADAVVDNTKNFSVSAWVKLDSSVGFSSVASQDGNSTSAFVLQYHDTLNRWAFRAADADVDDSAGAVAVSVNPPVWHEWTHLVGVYDAYAKELRLYVNGVLEGETTHAATWRASGPFVIGAGRGNGQRLDYFNGSIDSVQVWDRVVGPLEAAKLNNTAIPRAHYKLDEGTGTSTLDAITGQNATFEGGASWSSAEYTSARLPGDTGARISAARPFIRTGHSITVSAWVRLDAADGAKRTALSFTDPQYSPFLLGYDGTSRKWEFFAVNAAHSASWSALSKDLAVANTWVYLTGVYDSTSQEIRLYVDGQLSTTRSGVVAWGGTGSMQISGGTWNGQILPGWKGHIDDVRVYSGVRDQAGVVNDMNDRAGGR